MCSLGCKVKKNSNLRLNLSATCLDLFDVLETFHG